MAAIQVIFVFVFAFVFASVFIWEKSLGGDGSSMTNMAATLHRLLITLITQMCLSPPTYILYNDFLLFPFFYHHFSQYLHVKCFCCSFNFSIPALQANTMSWACMGTGRQSVSCLPTFNHHYLSAMIPQRPGLITNSNWQKIEKMRSEDHQGDQGDQRDQGESN